MVLKASANSENPNRKEENKLGKEIRRVPPNWEHPTNKLGHFIPMFDETYEAALAEWTANKKLWDQGKHPNQEEFKEETAQHTYEEWAGPAPNREYHRPEFQEEPTWYQVYENITEGTPQTPPFATTEELEEYLVEEGMATPAQASAFIRQGDIPNLVIGPEEILSGYAVAEWIEKEDSRQRNQ